MIHFLRRCARTLSLACALAPGFVCGPAQGEPLLPATDMALPSAGSQPPEPMQTLKKPVISNVSRTVKAAGSDTTTSIVAEPQPSSPGQIEFQTFIQKATGRSLGIFGHTLFNAAPSTFAPVENIPVTHDYLIGPGDEIQIQGWGQMDMDLRISVDRTGSIYIPKVGNLRVAGLKYEDLRGFLKTAIGRVYRNFDLNVNLGQLRSIQVFVVGHARRPGNYTISSLSTLVNALFASGGPSASGSMRHIQLKRGNAVVTEFDLYDLLLKGDKSKDASLLPGDVIFIPPVGQLVGIVGSVRQPAIYELKTGNTLGDLLDWTGGLDTVARGQKVTVERILNRASREVEEFMLDGAGQARTLRDGDLVTVYALSQRLENAVSLRGNVAQPARFPWHEGMRVRDVIPDREALIAPDYWLNNNADTRQYDMSDLRQHTGLRKNLAEINWSYAVIERLDWRDLTTSLLPFDLGKAVLEKDPASNLLLQPGDTLVVFSKDDIQVPLTRQNKVITLEGEFARPGIYQVEPGETLRHLVERTGGVTANAYLYATEFSRASTRKLQQEKYGEIVSSLEKEFEQSAQLRLHNASSPEEVSGIKSEIEARRARFAQLREMKAKGRIVLELPASGARAQDLPEIPIEDGDRLLVPASPATVSVFGAVFNENNFLYKPEKRLADYLAQAGGPTRFADDSYTFVLRADGSVASRRDNGWLFGSLDGTRIKPGDSIVVPEETEHTTWVKSLKDWTQILYQFGLGAAALKTIK